MVKVHDIAYVRLAAPDLDAQEQFLTDFGTVRSARTANALYMRGTDAHHHLHITEQGPARFIGLGYTLDSEDDLHAAGRLPGASGIENIDEPGGGRRVWLREPNGYRIELVYGIATPPALPVPPSSMNIGTDRSARVGIEKRLARGPSHVKRLGHCVFVSPNPRATFDWFHQNLGFLESDIFYAGSRDKPVAIFGRVDRGAEFVDHHVILCPGGERAGLNHLGFEVHDLDDLQLGHDHLKRCERYQHVWGIGRHLSGAHVFDYWMDPSQRIHEHWTDGDILDVSHQPNWLPIEELRSQWGDPAPLTFIKHVST
jgi:catechol 2,3-dioxygenase-like lactoylglutathione lyase family enzyme